MQGGFDLIDQALEGMQMTKRVNGFLISGEHGDMICDLFDDKFQIMFHTFTPDRAAFLDRFVSFGLISGTNRRVTGSFGLVNVFCTEENGQFKWIYKSFRQNFTTPNRRPNLPDRATFGFDEGHFFDRSVFPIATGLQGGVQPIARVAEATLTPEAISQFYREVLETKPQRAG